MHKRSERARFGFSSYAHKLFVAHVRRVLERLASYTRARARFFRPRRYGGIVYIVDREPECVRALLDFNSLEMAVELCKNIQQFFCFSTDNNDRRAPLAMISKFGCARAS